MGNESPSPIPNNALTPTGLGPAMKEHVDLTARDPDASSFGLLGAPLCFLVVVIAAWLAFARPPAVLDVEADGFSTQRALDELAFVASAPRPIGADHHASVRERLMSRIAELGPGVDVRRQTGSREDQPLSNVVARLAGRNPTGSVLFVCHYDTHPDEAGAADDGIAVVALLQTLELLRRGEEPTNDLLFLFTDGEEVDLLGAQLFAEEHPWMADVKCVLNFDAIGNDGPLVMFETGPASGELVRTYARSAPHPLASSLAPTLYARLPRDTDFTVFRKQGLPGLNFAIVGGGSAHHDASDTPANAAPESIQLVGETALALARELAHRDLSTIASEDLGYFDVGARHLLYWPRDVWRWLSLAAGALGLLALVRVGRPERAKLGQRVFGALLGLVLLALTAAGTYGVHYGSDYLAPFLTEPGPLTSNRASSTWSFYGLAACAFALVSAWSASTRRRSDLQGAVGAFGLVLALAPVGYFALEGDFGAGAQLSVAAGLSALAALLWWMLGWRTLSGLCSIAAVFLTSSLCAIVYHLLSKDADLAARVGAVSLSFVAFSVLPYLGAVRHRLSISFLLLMIGLACSTLGAVMRLQGS